MLMVSVQPMSSSSLKKHFYVSEIMTLLTVSPPRCNSNDILAGISNSCSDELLLLHSGAHEYRFLIHFLHFEFQI